MSASLSMTARSRKNFALRSHQDKEKQRKQYLQQITFLYGYTNTHIVTKIKVRFKDTF